MYNDDIEIDISIEITFFLKRQYLQLHRSPPIQLMYLRKRNRNFRMAGWQKPI